MGDVPEIGSERQRRGVADKRAAESAVSIGDRSRDLGVGANPLVDTTRLPLARERGA